MGVPKLVVEPNEVSLVCLMTAPVVPSGFVRLRHYGLQANRVRAKNLARCRVLLGLEQGSAAGGGAAQQEPEQSRQAEAGTRPRCPICAQGHMVIVGQLKPERSVGPEAEVVVVGVEVTDTS